MTGWCRLLAMFLCLLLPLTGFAGDLRLAPAEVINGGTAVLRWSGEMPAFGVMRFNGRVIHLYPDLAGAIALLPVPLDLPAGAYPVSGAVVDRHGGTVAFELELLVRYLERPQENLTLPERLVSPRAPEDLARIGRERERLDRLFAVRSERMWDRFERPVDDPVSSVFGKRRLLNGQPRDPHSGTDFRSPAGTPVRAMSAGRVALDDDLFYTGHTVILDHGEGLHSVYANLSASRVETGQLVKAGDVIGKVGSTGRSTGPHLHLTLRLLGEKVDPVQFLEALAR